MPTWPGAGPPPPQFSKIRSPGCRSAWDTRVVTLYWSDEEWGSETPACSQAHIVNPEQSKESGPAAPYWYGLPISCSAQYTAVDAPPLGGGAGPLPGEEAGPWPCVLREPALAATAWAAWRCSWAWATRPTSWPLTRARVACSAAVWAAAAWPALVTAARAACADC